MLRLAGLKKWFPIRRGVLRRTVGHVHAVDGVSLQVLEGETLGLVGESGCGKSTLINTALRLDEPTGGKVEFRIDGRMTDVAALRGDGLMQFRRGAQLVFQDPADSMNPRFTVLDVIGEPLRLHGMAGGAELREKVEGLLDAVGLPASCADRKPGAFSGGQQQRIGIARALALQPSLVVADEPVSALDVSVQSQVLNLMNDLKRQFGLAYLFVAHNLHVVRYLADRIAVMYLGRIVEEAPSAALSKAPGHPYTAALLAATPAAHPRDRSIERGGLEGDPPDPADPPAGCRFHPRCRFAQEPCRQDAPALRDLGAGRKVACHFAEELAEQGALTC